jgi:hypothetical protein
MGSGLEHVGGGGAAPSEGEEDSEGAVDAAGEEHACGEPLLGEEDEGGEAEGRLFDDGGEHERAVTDGVARDDEKRQLPGDGHSHEAIKELRVRDGRRVGCADLLFQKILRHQDEQAVDASETEGPAREGHGDGIVQKLDFRFAVSAMYILTDNGGFVDYLYMTF